LSENRIKKENYPPKWHNKEERILLEITTKINLSESDEKVKKAIHNIFPTIDLVIEDNFIIRGKSSKFSVLNKFCNLLYEQKILDGARKCFLEGIEFEGSDNLKQKSVLHLNKQTALYGKVNFSSPSESPLGPITISIETTNFELFSNAFFPKFEWFQ
jgi:predicted RNA binding protein with dsRBD fold (UPF0201 family)